MLGAIAGDIVGSVYEARPIKTRDFPLFSPASRITDDSVLTVAVAYALMTDGDYAAAVRSIGRRYPNAGYGGSFVHWLFADDAMPYNSWGNGSAMRVSPVGFAMDTREAVMREARRSAEITHNHPEGIKGAQATALSVWMGRQGQEKAEIRQAVASAFGYDLSRTLADIRPGYGFDVSCQGSVPEAIIAFLESESFEDAIRNAVSLGGDSDTLACIAGGIAHAYYGEVPADIEKTVFDRLPEDLAAIVRDFSRQYGI
ncbi:MAG: ADP-ribosylglycohydrolase family protein [Thermodesulfobacteriota bacterium]|nr:ADP-ribosylglycohydrolase family protein [Thermodesulfobacteriota bacterium]